MAAKRVLIITNERVANPAGVPELVANQVREADAVCVVAPVLTSRLHSWVSDIDAEFHEADERMRMPSAASAHRARASAAGSATRTHSRRSPTLLWSSRRMR